MVRLSRVIAVNANLALRCLPAASLRAGGINRGVADQFCCHQAGNKQLAAVIVKINRCPLSVGFGHNSNAILFMADLLPIGKNLHVSLLLVSRQQLLSDGIAGAGLRLTRS